MCGTLHSTDPAPASAWASSEVDRRLEAALGRQHRLAGRLGYLLIANFALSLLGSRPSETPPVGPVDVAELVSGLLVSGAAAILHLGIGVAGAVLWLMWTRCAYDNLLLVGTGRRERRGVVLCWFVPLMNLVRPYQVIRELWVRSECGNRHEDIRGLAAPRVILVWWLLFLPSMLPYRMAAWLWGHLSVGTWRPGEAIRTAIWLGAAFLAYVLVQRIDDFQMRFSRQTGEGAGLAPAQEPEAGWIDPRVWAALVPAYTLFLIVVTAAEYNDAWSEIFVAWIPTPHEARPARLWIGAFRLAVLLLPFVISQAIVAAWLLVEVRPRRPATGDRAAELALEVFRAAGVPTRGLRRPRIATGVVAQPVVVSLAGRPLLVLPRQGLAYFHLYLGDRAEAAFRSVIGHEAAHVMTFDDLLFFPWFCYCACDLAVCVAGLALSAAGGLSLSTVMSHVLMVIAIYVLGLYVIRRREAYADAFSVMLGGDSEPTRSALSALAQAPSRSAVWGAVHFDAAKRLEFLRQRGRRFLDLSGVDLGIAAFIYLGPSRRTLAVLTSQLDVASAVSAVLDGLANLLLLFYLLLVTAGVAVARGGVPPRRRDLARAAAVCVVMMGVHRALADPVSSQYAILGYVFTTFMDVVTGTVALVFVGRLFHRCAVAVLAHPGEHTRTRLVAFASAVAASVGIAMALLRIGFAVVIASTLLQDSGLLANLSMKTAFEVRDVLPLVPVLLIIVGFVLSWALFGAALYVWTSVRTRSAGALLCRECGQDVRPWMKRRPLLQFCPRCGRVVRTDLIVPLGRRAAAC